VNLEERLEVCRRLVAGAGQVALGLFGRVAGRLKHDRSLVSEADLAVEDYLRRELARAFPGEALMSEETAGEYSPDLLWVADPIDGTAAFLSRLPTWAVALGLVVEGQPVLGALALPAMGESYYAARGLGAWMESERWGKERLAASSEPLHPESVLYVPSASRRWRLDFPGKVRSLGCTVLHLALVARGDAAGALVRGHPWDLVPAAPLLTEAGAELVRLDGGPVDLVARRGLLPPMLAATPAMAARLLPLVAAG
jgi:myo-inositol-1(or 4)-monophosphatase